MTLLAINWSNIGSQILQLILSLSILVAIHEFGHYITAKWFKCRVEKFYLFFDPWFSIFKKKIGETEYGIGWLPLGGYVKISGMIDESMDKEQMALPPQDWEFRSKPAWQRLIIMLAGVTMNILLAFVIYAMVLWVWGEEKTNNASLKNGVYCADSLLLNLGFQNGDKIVSVNDKTVKYFEDVPGELILSDKVVVERAGKLETINLPKRLLGQLTEEKKKGTQFLEIRRPAIVGDLSSNVFDSSNAKKAGLKQFDKILAVDSIAVAYFNDLAPILSNKKNGVVSIEIDRAGVKQTIACKVSNEGKLGLPPITDLQMDSLGLLKVDVKSYSFLGSFPAGINKTFEKLGNYTGQVKRIATPGTEGYKAVGGFKRIASIFPTPWNWQAFWSITAFLSVMLAFMNLLPIPALDGGHVMFTLYEMISGRKPSEKFLERAQIVGMIILLGLMLFANGNDWFGWGKGK
jgi:regulator of sigma E protease